MDTQKTIDVHTNDIQTETENLEDAVLNGEYVENAVPDGLPELTPEMAASLEEFTKKLQRSEDLEREVGEWKTRYVRLQQDFESYRNRTANDATDAKTKGEANAVEAVLPVYDDLSRAIDAGVKDPTALIPGMKSVLENFLKALEGFGCQTVPGVGSIFDPHVHEALTVAPGDDDDTILEVFQTGFTLRGKLVRPARVVVSKRI